ncbi:MAG TPA: hypothetical protein VHZ55_25645, partial [Bryobacteraceae bacterium]|nr:hypothetical protein [Bryobacteraceae bacterium]
MEFAKLVQARLFPQKFPQLETLDYAGRCIQAKQVGGDYYDFLQVQQGQAVVLRNNVVETVTLPQPIHIRDASRRESVWRSLVILGLIEWRPAEPAASLEVDQGCQVPKSDADDQHCTNRQRKTHITDVQEVHYWFHPWYGQRVVVESGGIRSGAVMFRCRRDDERGFPVL